MSDAPIVMLPKADPVRLAGALEAVLGGETSAGRSALGRLPSVSRLREGAEQTLATETRDSPAAGAFQALLELGYLVASADGLADSERDALASLFERATGSAVDRDTMTQHFRDLDDAVAALGRRERLHRVAAGLAEVEASGEAIGFCALVALADGVLYEPEMQALVELGEGLGLSPAQVRAVVDDVARRVTEELR